MSQVSIDDILEYTSNNEELLVGVQPVQDDEQVPDFVPDSSAQQEVVLDPLSLSHWQGYRPNIDIFAINKQELGYRAGKTFVPLAPPTAQMLQNAAEPSIGELVPQDHPEWQNLRSGNNQPYSTISSLVFDPYAVFGAQATMVQNHCYLYLCTAHASGSYMLRQVNQKPDPFEHILHLYALSLAATSAPKALHRCETSFPILSNSVPF